MCKYCLQYIENNYFIAHLPLKFLKFNKNLIKFMIFSQTKDKNHKKKLQNSQKFSNFHFFYKKMIKFCKIKKILLKCEKMAIFRQKWGVLLGPRFGPPKTPKKAKKAQILPPGRVLRVLAVFQYEK